jgi:GNAT superfamily N-acetyltransferase
MATTDGLAQSVLEPENTDGVMALVEEAGWNQVAEDWQLMCQSGEAVILKDENDCTVASALAIPYSGGFGWISMVLVAKTARRRGLATKLLNDRVAWLQERNLVPVLDATEAGELVYKKAGFTADLRFTRWQGKSHNLKPVAADAREALVSDRDGICSMDAEIFCADRRHLITDFLSRNGSRCFVTETTNTGFIISRKGRTATQLGPLIAASESDAISLLKAALAVSEGPVFFDLLDTRFEVAAYISSLGFTQQRSFARMSLGPIPDFTGNGRTMIVAGPEYG